MIRGLIRALRTWPSKGRARLAGLRWNVSFGGAVEIGTGVAFKATDGGRISIARGVALQRYCALLTKYGGLEIGENTFVGTGSQIVVREKVVIGSDCLIAEYVTIRDQNHKIVAGQKTRDMGFDCAPITIGNNVWIGAKATILPGVTIGDNSVVAAHAVVTRDVAPNVVVAGIPAKVLREIV